MRSQIILTCNKILYPCSLWNKWNERDVLKLLYAIRFMLFRWMETYHRIIRTKWLKKSYNKVQSWMDFQTREWKESEKRDISAECVVYSASWCCLFRFLFDLPSLGDETCHFLKLSTPPKKHADKNKPQRDTWQTFLEVPVIILPSLTHITTSTNVSTNYIDILWSLTDICILI